METPAIERAPYGRERKSSATTDNSSGPHYQGETYYGQPAIKPSHYGQLVASYLFIGGLAGASQIIATIAELCGRDEDCAVVRAGRYMALAGALAGPVFLIADLRTPERWYNMLRIFRRTSTMSIGAWSLVPFGAMSALTAAAQGLADRLGNVFTGVRRAGSHCPQRRLALSWQRTQAPCLAPPARHSGRALIGFYPRFLEHQRQPHRPPRCHWLGS